MFQRHDLLDERVRFVAGDAPSMIDEVPVRSITMLRIAGLEIGELDAVLPHVAPLLVPGALVYVDRPPTPDLGELGLSIAAQDGLGGVVYRFSVPEDRSPLPVPARSGDDAPTDPSLDLSVVLVLYNMQREANRTLHSLSRRYQLDLEERTYEVLVVDNGSDPEQRLSAGDVAAFGAEFRLIEMGDDATASPVPALRRATGEARGRTIAFMIDGAHVLTPRVLSHGLRGIDAFRPAVVATQQMYVGPGQQNDAMLQGYDTEFEDELFERIEWPSDGYRLFDIGVFIGHRDWFDGMWESNCLFAPRTLVDQVGGFDARFDEPGGGFANLDLYERLGAHPGVRLVSILGEGSFHQTHGGTTTNQAEIEERSRKIVGYRRRFEEIHGRPFLGPSKPIHYVGSVWGSSKRSKARHLASPLFADVADELDRSIPVPDDVTAVATSALFRSPGWQTTRWGGHPVARLATDLVAYQELLERVRPDVILVTNSGDDGGLPGFVARMCDLWDHGRIIAVGPERGADDHERITWLAGRAQHPTTAQRVRAAIGAERLLVIIGRDKRHPVARTFAAYSDLVPPAGYVIFEETAVNGNPCVAVVRARTDGSGPEHPRDLRRLRRRSPPRAVRGDDESVRLPAATRSARGGLTHVTGRAGPPPPWCSRRRRRRRRRWHR